MPRSPAPTSPRPFAAPLFLFLFLSLLAACGVAPPATEFSRPEFYPDLTSAELAWESFLWAWREGDVGALERCYLGDERQKFDALVAANGRAAVAEYYRAQAGEMRIVWARFTDLGPALANIVARFEAPETTPREVKFSFIEKEGTWHLFAIRAIR